MGLGNHGTGRSSWDVTLYVATGQSLSVGVNSGAAISTAQPYSNVKLFDSSGTYDITSPSASTLSLVALVAPQRAVGAIVTYPNNIAGESPDIAFANQLTALGIAGGRSAFRIATSCVGQSGQPMSVIRKGGSGNAYAASLYECRAIMRLVRALGLTFGVGGIYLTHGESDAASTTYAADLAALQANYQADLQAITGQSQPIPMFLSQQNSFPNTATTPNQSLSAYAQLAASVANPSLIVFTGPKYINTYGGDNIHMPAASYIALGEKNAQIANIVRQGIVWSPLRPVSFTRVGAVVTIAFNVPVGPLVFDGSVTPPHQTGSLVAWKLGKGFEAADSSGIITISSVTISGNAVVLTMARSPVSSLVIAYADTADGFGAGFNTGRCGLLRDSDPFVGRSAASGGVYFNWAPQFAQAVA